MLPTPILVVAAAIAVAMTPTAAAAQEASPSPSPTPSRVCGQPDRHSVTADPTDITSGESTVITVMRRLEPCYPTESRSHEVTLYARLAGSNDAGEVVASGRTDEYGLVRFTHSPMQSTEYSDRADFVPQANGPRTVRVYVDGQHPADERCHPGVGVMRLEVIDAMIAAGQYASVRFEGSPGIAYELVAYTRPSTDYRVVRRGSVPEGQAAVFTWAVRPTGNTRLYVRTTNCTESFGEPERQTDSQVITVRPAVSLGVVRNARRDYTFSGRVLPARGQLVTLYRLTADQRAVLTAQTHVAEDGTYILRRRFTGSGTFGFVTRTGQDLTNAAGRSGVRATSVY